ncbi:MAG TPA: prepilin-type N-terminal cleavage/methylation domain-containing protein [Candidatus Sulfotelmatobacter sp.]|jgi:prepilin-type N-terminal cleavage/methylation domain-containing protein|nr:prepilin-type N-terminal cleavage/methylation domain-containing protein [Candidatus Sulfotelmatobacter sp.]
MTSNKERGFSLLELMITVTIGMIIAGVTFISMRPLFNRSHLDNGYDTTLMALRDTRHLAITQSHEYYVNFNPGGFAAGTITVTYQPAAVGGILPAQQFVKSYTLPTDISFAVVAGFPANAPDNFGAGIQPIDFGQGLGLGSLNYVTFMPDGSSRDNLGNYNSGVVYLTRPLDNMYSSRAISVWGATGRVRGWRLIQQSGAPVWMQQ